VAPSVLDRLALRHRSGRWAALLHEAHVRAYRIAAVRPVLRRFHAERTPERIVFVVGCYNSGTTLVRDLLRAHPDTSGPPVEGDQLTTEIGDLEDGGWPRGLFGNADTLVAAERTRAVDPSRLLRDWSPWIRSKAVLVEKSISNSLRMPALRDAFPGVRFVWVLRDPHEVADGIQRRSRPASGGEYSRDFLLGQWEFINRAIAEAFTATDTTIVAYGQLLETPIEVTHRLFSFLGLPDVEIREGENGMDVGGAPVPLRGSSRIHPGEPVETWSSWPDRAEVE